MKDNDFFVTIYSSTNFRLNLIPTISKNLYVKDITELKIIFRDEDSFLRPEGFIIILSSVQNV